ncbi:thioredoxin-dependent thiol peroxidase [Meiothermus sp.]|uniref:thioredoxin-dependent thiol peroxidase n=1 Tax=Meiothermus sp. TaxID=1955249 RepID=UPI0021DD87EC|nr:thioredoxin-dependent thiol peroxidase [Meiothermus sp.]GIW35116.1 MAG: peroxiredoxin [Meiothermus sp.]
MLNPGVPAPDFSLPDQSGKKHSLTDYRGSWVVLYFYPKDDTPGCTKEACNFRDEKGRLEELGAVVLGVSADDVQSHGKFHRKYDLNFPLLSDPDTTMIRAYGAWGKKVMYGKEYEGVFRYTFLIDPEGRVAKVWDKVKPDQHALEVAEALVELQKQAV